MRESPPIPFVTKVKKVHGDPVEADKTELIKFNFFVDPENPASTSFLRMEDRRTGSSG
jgi:hypothetical protein